METTITISCFMGKTRHRNIRWVHFMSGRAATWTWQKFQFTVVEEVTFRNFPPNLIFYMKIMWQEGKINWTLNTLVNWYTVEPLKTNTQIRRTPPYNGFQILVSAVFFFFNHLLYFLKVFMRWKGNCCTTLKQKVNLKKCNCNDNGRNLLKGSLMLKRLSWSWNRNLFLLCQ